MSEALRVTLTEPQRRHIAALLRADIRKGQRRIANAAAAGRAFVPGPGRRDVAKWELDRKRELLALIEGASTPADPAGAARFCATCGYPIYGTDEERAAHARVCAAVHAR